MLALLESLVDDAASEPESRKEKWMSIFLLPVSTAVLDGAKGRKNGYRE